MRRIGLPHSYEAAIEGYNIGDVRTFPDGSERVLSYAPSGVRRWMSIKDAKDAKRIPEPNINESPAINILTETYPKEITIQEWLIYNKYLTEENPFLNITSYEQMVKVWFSQAYEYQNRIQEGFNIEENQKALKALDNYYLAIQCYKISFLISEIIKWEPEFDYKEFIKNKTWNDIILHLEDLKQPTEVNYSVLYKEESNGNNIT